MNSLKSKHIWILVVLVMAVTFPVRSQDAPGSDSVTATATYSGTSAGFLGTRYAVPSALAGALSGPQLEAVNYYDSHDFLSRNPNSRFTGMSITAAVSQAGQLTGSTSVASDGTWLSQVMAYDIKGNLIEMTSRELDGRTVTQQNSYTFTGNPASSSCTASVGYGSSLTLSEAVQYNAYNDKKSSYTLTVGHGGTASATMVYNYDSLGRVSSVSRPLPPSVIGNVSYGYDMHGWLKGITTNSFREELYYADGPGTPCYNGNVSTMKWSNAGYPQKRGYRFAYDGANRLSSALYGEREALDNKTGRYDEVLAYDANGNVRHLERRGLKQNGVFGKIDNLNLSYSGNHLVSVEEDAPELLYAGSFDYKGSRGSHYEYNGNGSLVCDRSRGIAFITYDLSGNPRKTYFTNGNVTEYVYSASGQKLRVKHYTAVPNITRPLGVQPPELTAGQILHTDVTDYLLGGRVTMRDGRVDKVLFEGGYCQATQAGSSTDSFAFYYYNHDHLGNIREVVDASGTVQQVTNYYPFGTPYCDSPSAQSPDLQPYKYNGKELDRMHGLDTYDYGARQYDPVLCRWGRIDPLCEKYYGVSPYAYCENNPVKFVDPDGKQIITPIPMFGFTDILTFGRLDVMMADGGKIVEVQGRVASSSKQTHHWIPRQFKNHPTVEKAIRGGYKFEGKENKSPLNTFSKSTGKGQHANHPKYNQQIKNKLDNVDKSLSSKQTVKAVRQIKNAAQKAVEKDPNQKVNDVKIK